MAHVRVTQTLLQEMHTKITEMATAELARPSNQNPDYNSMLDADGIAYSEHFRDFFENLHWVEAPHLKGKLPDSWVMHKTGGVRLEFTPRDAEDEKVGLDFRIDENNPATSPIPFKWNYTYHADTWDTEESRIAPFIKRLQESYKKRTAIATKYAEISSELREFVAAHKSLNAALKAMPELEMYVPEKYIIKVEEKVTRSKSSDKPAPQINIDRDMLASTAIAHRLTGG